MKINAFFQCWLGGMLLAAGASGAANETQAGASGGALLTGFAGEGRLAYYPNPQDDLQEERYVTSGALTLDFALASIGARWDVRTRFQLLADFGTSVAENLPFSPKETTYEFTPYAEYTRGTWLARGGWNHTCQHLTFKDVEEPWYKQEGSNLPPDVYYNRLFVGAGRREIRPEILRESAFGAAPVRPRLIWFVEASGYLRSLAGMDGDSLYGGNDWVADLAGELKLLLYGADRWLLFANSRTQFWLDGESETYAREVLQLELVFDSRGFGSTLYAGWHVLDEHPRDSKEGLAELGATFYF